MKRVLTAVALLAFAPAAWAEERTGRGPEGPRVERLFKAIDANGDGKIDLEEMKAKLPDVMEGLRKGGGPPPVGEGKRPAAERAEGPPHEAKPAPPRRPEGPPAEMAGRVEEMVRKNLREAFERHAKELGDRVERLVDRKVQEALAERRGDGPMRPAARPMHMGPEARRFRLGMAPWQGAMRRNPPGLGGDMWGSRGWGFQKAAPPWQRELGKQRPALRGLGPRAEAWRRQQAAPPWAGPRFQEPRGDRERWNLWSMPFGREGRPERGEGWREGPRAGGRGDLWDRPGGPPRMKDDDRDRPRGEKDKKEKAKKGPKDKPRDKDKDDDDR